MDAQALGPSAPGPAGATAFLHGASFSFPSGHALGSLVGYGMVAYVLVAFRASGRGARALVVVAAGIVVAAVSLSRLYLGVHYLSDVGGGLALGLAWLSVCVGGAELALRRRRQTHGRARRRVDQDDAAVVRW